jgi:hypothetical protein
MGAHRKRGEGSADGMLTFAGWAVTYKDAPAPGQQAVEQFFKDIGSAPQMYRVREDAIAARDRLAREFSSGTWRVVYVELREVVEHVEATAATSVRRVAR